LFIFSSDGDLSEWEIEEESVLIGDGDADEDEDQDPRPSGDRFALPYYEENDVDDETM